jgi:GTP pyrophosphokinase
VSHTTYLDEVIAALGAELQAAGIEATITSRTKHIYSIYRKMLRKDLPAEEIYDVLAVRVLVDRVADCYLALGVVHTLWRPLEAEFDDYIAKKKSNLYQSLHTTVLGPGNRPLEVQIRTHEMHELAEYGVAAHWLYKEGSPRAREIDEKVAALRRILESHNEDAADAQAFVEGLKTDVFRDQVYVFTPDGDVIELPAGATPVDFAYYIHTEVGHRCRGALVNGRMVPLDTPLRTGQTVKIVTAKGAAGPSRDWLNPALGFIASSRARAKIKQWFRRQARSEAIGEGRDALERQLRKLGLTKVGHEEVAHLFGFERLDDFLAAIGRHDIPSEAIGAQLLEAEDRPAGPNHVRTPPPAHTPPRDEASEAAGVTMRGADGLYTRVARCCRPVPGEEVVGYITRGQGVTLHRVDCQNLGPLRDSEPERLIRVDWRDSARQTYPVELAISAYDRAGLVRDIAEVIAQRNVNMSSVSASTDRRDGRAIVTAIVEIPSHTELTGLIDRLEMVDNVIEVRRPAG